MVSVLGRLEERERAARKRVEELQAELEAAQSEWDEWLVARRRVGEVWGDGGETAGQDGEAGKTSDGSEAAVPVAAKSGSVVPVWREGLSAEVLAPEYQQVMGLLAERRAVGGQLLNCREITALLGLEVVRRRPRACGASSSGSLRGDGRTSRCRAGSPAAMAETAGHEHGHRPQDHRLRRRGQPLVVAGEAPGAGEPGGWVGRAPRASA
jgi:hypothetical protein